MYINFQTIKKGLFLTAVGAATLVSCSKSDDNNNNGGGNNTNPQAEANRVFSYETRKPENVTRPQHLHLLACALLEVLSLCCSLFSPCYICTWTYVLIFFF